MATNTSLNVDSDDVIDRNATRHEYDDVHEKLRSIYIKVVNG